MKESLRIAFIVGILVIAIACFALGAAEDKPWNPLPGRREAFDICFYTLMTWGSVFDVNRTRLARIAKGLCAGLAGVLLAAGITALFFALPEETLRWLGTIAVFNFAAGCLLSAIFNRKARKKKETPQEKPL